MLAGLVMRIFGQAADRIGPASVILTAVAVATAALSLAHFPHAAAQQSPLAKVDASGACPANLTELRSTMTQSGRPGAAPTSAQIADILRSERQIARNGVRLFQADNLLEGISGDALKFGTKVVTFQAAQGTPRRLFVRVAGSDRCGWMREEDAFTVRDPLLLTDIIKDAQTQEEGRRRNPSKLQAKVVAMAISKDQKLFKVPVYSDVFDVAQLDGNPAFADPLKVGEVGYFAVLNVYDRKRFNAAGCDDITSKDCFVLVGGLTESAENSAPVPVIHGWVRGDHIALWPSALSLYYRSEAKGIRIFRNDRAPKALISGRQPREEDLLALQEDRHTEPTVQNIPRFPIVDSKDQGKGQQIVQIVFAGETCQAGDKGCNAAAGPMAGGSGVAATQERAKLGRDIYGSKGLDLLFVVDGTESMEVYYAPVIKAIENITREAREQKLRIRVAAATYGDYESDKGTPQSVVFKWVARFTPVNAPEGVRRLTAGRVGTDPHADKPEAMFAGIVRAVSEAEWKDDQYLSLVILIGDHGARPKGRHSTAAGAVKSVEETLDEQSVVAELEKLKQSGKARFPIFTALQVRGRFDPENNGAFQRQVNKIIEQRGNLALPLRQLDTADNTPPDEITRRVEAALRDIMDVASLFEQNIENASRTGAPAGGGTPSSSATPSAAADLSLPKARLANHILKELGWDADKLGRMAAEVQAIRTGFVVQDENKPDFAYWLALREREYQNLQDAMNRFCNALGSSELNKDVIQDSMSAVLQAATFEEPGRDDQSIHEFLEKKWSVPRRHFSETLSRSITQFANWFVSATAQEQGGYRANVCKKSKMYDYIVRNQRVKLDDIVIDPGSGRASLRQGVKTEPFNWDWSITTGIRYYFIPLEYLP